MAIAREHVLSEIRRTAAENGGRPLGRSRFADETGIRQSDLLKYWARWGDAVREAGFEPNQLQGRYHDDVVLARLVEEIRRLGRFPTMAELRLRLRVVPMFPSRGVFDKYGSKTSLVGRVADYCGERADAADVLAIVD